MEKLVMSGRKLSVKKIAVMGCEVNGPGEAKDADIGIAGGAGGIGMLFKHGKPIKKIKESKWVSAIIEEILSGQTAEKERIR
jgi:(E)-4-hydroxy-3-methylbut-2-enyl-diphosphate synthase